MKCPHPKESLEKALHTTKGEAISYFCNKCKEEVYRCPGDLLLTKKEFVKRRREEGEG